MTAPRGGRTKAWETHMQGRLQVSRISDGIGVVVIGAGSTAPARRRGDCRARG